MSVCAVKSTCIYSTHVQVLCNHEDAYNGGSGVVRLL